VRVTQANEGRSIDALVARLSATYSHVPAERIADVVRGAYARFDDRPLREYVPLFVERRARRELGELDA
jgi:hypothetical protein